MGRKKKTHEQFVNEVYQLVGDEYKVLGTYIHSNKYILIKHNICNYEWDITPNNFLNGYRCPACSGNKKYTYEEVKEYVENLKYELISKEYIGIHSKLILKDIKGYYYFINFNNLKSFKNPDKFHVSNPYTIQNIKLWCKLNNKSYELISDTYKGNNKYLKWKCLKEECGEIFEMCWANILQGQNCSYCAGKRVGISNCLATKNPELAKQWHPTKNGDLTPYDVTIGYDKKVWWKCEKGHEWPTTILHRIEGTRCPYCAGLLPSEEYNLLVCYPELASEWDYERNKGKPEDYCPSASQYVYWICKDCGHKWKVKINSRASNKRGCPECNKSKGEKECKKVLLNNNFIEINQEDYDKLSDIDRINNIYFIPQKEFDGLIGVKGGNLSYDFYIPNLNLLIEYHGGQHEKFTRGIHKTMKDFERQVEHDNRKCEYAYYNKIKLLIIWYWDFDNIEEILDNILF